MVSSDRKNIQLPTELSDGDHATEISAGSTMPPSSSPSSASSSPSSPSSHPERARPDTSTASANRFMASSVRRGTPLHPPLHPGAEVVPDRFGPHRLQIRGVQFVDRLVVV